MPTETASALNLMAAPWNPRPRQPMGLRESAAIPLAFTRTPQPRGTADAARIAMDVAQEARIDVIRCDIARPQPGHVLVQAVDVAHAAAQHDDVGIDDVDHVTERAGETFLVSLKS